MEAKGEQTDRITKVIHITEGIKIGDEELIVPEEKLEMLMSNLEYVYQDLNDLDDIISNSMNKEDVSN